MKTILVIIQVLSAILLAILILLQQPKGEGLGAIGGQARMFNTPKNVDSGIKRVTYITAAVFMLAALILSFT